MVLLAVTLAAAVALVAADVGSACNDDASCVSVKLPEACGAALAGVAVSELCPVSCGTCHVVRAKRAAQQPTIKTEGKTLVFEGASTAGSCAALEALPRRRSCSN